MSLKNKDNQLRNEFPSSSESSYIKLLKRLMNPHAQY